MLNTNIVEKQAAIEPVALRAWAEARTIYIELTDGRIIGFPADRFSIGAVPKAQLKLNVKKSDSIGAFGTASTGLIPSHLRCPRSQFFVILRCLRRSCSLLKRATNEELRKVTLRLNGYALRWEDLDEDNTVHGIVESRFELPYEGMMASNHQVR